LLELVFESVFWLQEVRPNDPNGNHNVVKRRQDKTQGQGGNVRITLNR